MEEAMRQFLRMWTQGLIANYSSANVNGAHQIIEVSEGHGYTDVVVQSAFNGMVVRGADGKPYRNQGARFSVTVTCDTTLVGE